jgi:hypothetical protein
MTDHEKKEIQFAYAEVFILAGVIAAGLVYLVITFLE